MHEHGHHVCVHDGSRRLTDARCGGPPFPSGGRFRRRSDAFGITSNCMGKCSQGVQLPSPLRRPLLPRHRSASRIGDSEPDGKNEIAYRLGTPLEHVGHGKLTGPVQELLSARGSRLGPNSTGRWYTIRTSRRSRSIATNGGGSSWPSASGRRMLPSQDTVAWAKSLPGAISDNSNRNSSLTVPFGGGRRP